MNLDAIALAVVCATIRRVSVVASMAIMEPSANSKLCWVKPGLPSKYKNSHLYKGLTMWRYSVGGNDVYTSGWKQIIGIFYSIRV